MHNYTKLAAFIVSAITFSANGAPGTAIASASNEDLAGIQDSQAAVYFKSSAESANYDGYSLFVWNDENCANAEAPTTDWNKGLAPDGVSETHGAYWILDLNNDVSQCVNFIPRDAGLDKPLGDNFDAKLDFNQLSTKGKHVFTKEGVPAVFPEMVETLPDNTARVFLNMEKSSAEDMKLHVWNDESCSAYAGADTGWDSGLPVTGFSETYGAYWDIGILHNQDGKQCVNFIPHNGDDKPLLGNTQLDLAQAAVIGNLAFTFAGDAKVYYTPLSQPPAAQVKGASAHWLDLDVIAVKNGASRVTLLHSANGSIAFNGREFTGVDQQITATKTDDSGWKTKYPHLSGLDSWQLDLTGTNAKDLLKGQLYAVVYNSAGNVEHITQVQTAGVIDALYTGVSGTGDELQYGAMLEKNMTVFRLWAPTAVEASVVSYGKKKNGKGAKTEIPMTFDPQSGAWSVETKKIRKNEFYRYKIKVFHPAVNEMREYEVTDPYSLSLSINSEFSQVVDLDHPSLKPGGWDSLGRPHDQTNPAEIVIYESHVRDFSALDQSTSAQNRGKFTAFSENGTAPVEHLKSLADNGVTHLHLLPVFDIATINEDSDNVADIDEPFSKLCSVNPAVASSEFAAYCAGDEQIAGVLNTLLATDGPDSAKVQQLNRYVSATDSFNWGYDPLHYTVPEGSYSTDPDGTARIKEFRQMVQSIKQDIKMNVVMDVVYNHTNDAGPNSKYSVLDKIVPWYYQRLNPETGAVESSTCCSNTAPEHVMMGKLIDDSLVVWARDYKIDSFRFDLMGHHPKDQIMQSLAAVQAVDPDTYFYGEGWNFGEVANDQRFVQATQLNMAGTGVGTFSDRLRDAVRGGGPFDGGEWLRNNQGFGNGAFVQPNEAGAVSRENALHLSDLVRIGMAGNLKDFKLVDANDTVKRGDQVDYNGQPAGYTVNPTEIQNYVSKHDNQTLWDNNQYKIPYDVEVTTRVRMQAVSLATSMLGQGVPFTHMGVELLRSKSMQRDSYDSGDWYNKVDFTLADNNWDKGLPRADKDQDNWQVIQNVIDTNGPKAAPAEAELADMVAFYKELANLRQQYPLLTLGTGERVNARVDFHNTGSAQEAGLIIMSVDNGLQQTEDLDPQTDALVVAINATPALQNFDIGTTGFALSEFHQTELATAASVSGTTLNIPAWTPAVFVMKRNGARSQGLPVIKKNP